MNIKVRRSGLQLDLDSDVSYELSVESKPTLVSVHIRAETVFGARNGLETLSQLITYDDSEHKLQVSWSLSEIDANGHMHIKFMYFLLTIIDTAHTTSKIISCARAKLPLFAR